MIRAQEKEIEELKSKIAQVLAVMPTDTFGPGPTNSSGMSKLRLPETPSPCPGCTVSNLDPNATAYTPKGSLIASTEAWIVARQVDQPQHIIQERRRVKCSILYSNKIEYISPFPVTLLSSYYDKTYFTLFLCLLFSCVWKVWQITVHLKGYACQNFHILYCCLPNFIQCYSLKLEHQRST